LNIQEEMGDPKFSLMLPRIAASTPFSPAIPLNKKISLSFGLKFDNLI